MIIIPSQSLSELVASEDRELKTLADCYLYLAEQSVNPKSSRIAVRDDLIKIFGINEVDALVLKENPLGHQVNLPFTDIYPSLSFITFEEFQKIKSQEEDKLLKEEETDGSNQLPSQDDEVI